MEELDDFIVVVNDKNQHSIWPGEKDIPAGWTQIGPAGSKEECTNWIEENWTDMGAAKAGETIQ